MSDPSVETNAVPITNGFENSSSVQALRPIDRAVPCYHKKPLNGKSAVHEGRAILAACEATRDVLGARTVRLVDVREDENSLSTELISSRGSLFNHLWSSAALITFRRGRWNRQQLEVAGQSLGAWLRAYHAGTSVVGSCVAEAEMAVARQARTRIKLVKSKAPGLLRESLVSALHDRIEMLEGRSTSANSALCAIHGDLNLSNVLVESGTGELVIIDFGNGRAGLGIEDVATVYCTVLAMRTVRGRSGRALDEFLAGLLDAYGRNALASNPMWPLMQIMCYLRLVLSYVDFKKKDKFSWLSERAYWQITRGSLQLLANECSA
jgi:Ser/Thr protein kinase RdoA (MazF antagonist)